MSSATPFDESQKLVRCDVINRYKEASVRLVEIEAFKLWQYLMTHKHGLQVSNPTLCLWVSQHEFDECSAVFERAGDVEPVDRILIDLFDEAHGFSQTSIRYARTSETEQVVKILRSHIPPELCDSPSCSVDVVQGQVVQQWVSGGASSQPLVLGLT